MATTFQGEPDLESNSPKQSADDNNSDISRTAVVEAGALLLLWSLLVINEGSVRFIASNPSFADLTARPSPPIIRLVGGIFEVFFGVLGGLVGAAALLKQWQNETLSKITMLTQTILGYYVFIVFVFAVPAIDASNLETPVLEGLTIGESKFLITLGILTSFHFCLALQGGQFVFMARLVTAATGKDFLKQKSGAKMRAIFWNSNLALSGLWTLITGALVNSKVGGGRLDMPFVSPPNVGRLPGFTISTGTTLLLWGLVGVVLAVLNWELPSWYYLGSGYVYLIAFLNYGIAQFALLPSIADGGPGSGPVLMHNGLVFMVVFIATYFSHLASEERKEATA